MGRIGFCCFAMAYMAGAGANPPGQEQPSVPVAGLPGVSVQMAVFADPAEPANAADTPPAKAPFKPVEGGLRTGFAGVPYWFRLDIDVPPSFTGTEALLHVEPAYLDNVRFFLPDGTVAQSGSAFAFPDHGAALRAPAARLTLKAPRTRVYVRVFTTGAMTVAMSLYSRAAFEQHLGDESLLYGMYFGALVLVLILSLLNWAWTRNPLYSSYAFFVAASVLHGLGSGGYLAALWLRDEPGISNGLIGVGYCLMTVTGIFFASRMMRAPTLHPNIDRFAKLTAVGVLAGVPMAFVPALWSWMSPAVTAVILTYGVGSTLLSAWDWRHRQGMGVTVLAYGLFMGAQAATMLTMFGILPSTVWTLHSWQFGALAHLLMLQVAMAQRVRQIERESWQVQAQAEEATRKREELIEFLGMLGHELRTPLAIIDSAVQSLKLLPCSEREENARRHERIRQAVARLRRLMHESLNREQFESNAWQVQWEQVDIAALVGETLRGFDTGTGLGAAFPARVPVGVGGREGALDLKVADGLPCIRGNKNLLQIALSNLIDNACKYAKPGSEISLAAGLAGGQVRLAVENRSETIPEEELAKFFDKYYRGGEKQNVPGNGLGLHLVHHIAHLHGGSVAAACPAPGRIRFTIELPVGENHAVA